MTTAFIFDLDGTLVDTAPDLLNTLNLIMVREGRREIGETEIRHLVGRGVKVLLQKAFQVTGAPIDTDRLEHMFDDYLELYGDHYAERSHPYPGVVETLTALQSEGVRMGVLTNKPHAIAKAILNDMGLMHFFGAVYGAGKREYLKPDPRLFPEVLEDIGGADKAVMIGDSITDVQTARGAGVPVVLLSYGYTPTPARELGADAVVDSFAGVPAAVRKLFGKSA